MSNKIGVECVYSFCVESVVDLPEGKSYKDIDSMYVKWGVVNVVWKDGTEWSADMPETDGIDSYDLKRPDETRVFTTVEGEIDWENEITEEVL